MPSRLILPGENFPTAFNGPLQPGQDPSSFPNLCVPELPIYVSKSDVIDAITEHSAVIVISPPGTGKSTQLPKIALEAGFDLVRQTQPRRRPAVNVGSRILYELGMTLGEEKASELVSWQTGAGRVGPRDAQLQVMTEGVLMRKEGFQPTKGDNELWMLDEVHEQGLYLEVLTGLAKEKRANNPNFTAVFSSATMDKHDLVEYLTDEFGQEPAVIELTAPMFDVEYRERPKSDLMKEILRAAKDIHENPDSYGGSNTIQVFESGVGEINDIIDKLGQRLPLEIAAKATILANHSKLSPKQQEPVYVDVDGVKIVIQTNIGKTSNTIPRTRYVITVGKERQPGLDKEGDPSLEEVQISQDDMAQQFGRAGRTSDGIAVHTKRDGEEYVPLSARDPHMIPEIKRRQLDEIVLFLAARGDNIRTFDFKNAPDPDNLELAIYRLKALGAIDSHERITKAGQQMFRFAASPKSQRSMVEAMNHPQTIRLAMAAMVAANEAGGLKRPVSKEAFDEADELSDETDSDMLAQLDIFIAAQGMTLAEMSEANINVDNYLRVQESYRKLANSADITDLPELIAPTEAERKVLRQCILAGYINDVYLPAGSTKEKAFFKRIGAAAYRREISERSVVDPLTSSPVIGVGRTIQCFVKGKRVPRPIIENVTKVSRQEIGRFATEATEWEPSNYRPRGDGFILVEHQTLGNYVLDAREVPAPPSPRLRAAVIEYVKDTPGKNLLYLYKIKSDIEALAHKSRLPVSKLTQDMIDAIIEDVTPEDVTNPSHVEENLRQYIQEHGVSLDAYIPTEERASITRNAPLKVVYGDVTLKLHYKQGKPLVYVRNDPEPFANLPDVMQLEDGRDILFVYDDKRYTSQQLKRKLQSVNLI